MKRTGFNGYVNDFSVDYDAISWRYFRHPYVFNEKK